LTVEQHQQPQPQQQSSSTSTRRIYHVTEGVKSSHTKRAYHLAFKTFLKATVKNDDLQSLLDTKRDVVESKIIEHITYLKDIRRLTYLSIHVHLSGIFHFFEINDYDLRTKKIKRFLPEDESDYYAKDRPYSVKEIEQILTKCDVRARVAVLLMTSTGMRIGGLRKLQIGDLKKIDEFGLYMIWVYNRSRKDRYYTFTMPECAKAIDEYLEYRKGTGGEDITKVKSPLIRDKFRMEDYFKAPNLISIRTLSHIFEDALKRAGVNQPTVEALSTKSRWQKKRDVMSSHGFHKFFITQCDKAHISFTVREYLSGHQLPYVDASYIRTTEEDRLAEYVKAIDLLTIDPTQRLQTRVKELETGQAQEIARIKAQYTELEAKYKLEHEEWGTVKDEVNELRRMFSAIDNEGLKHKTFDNMYQEVGAVVLDQWNNSGSAYQDKEDGVGPFNSDTYKQWARQQQSDSSRSSTKHRNQSKVKRARPGILHCDTKASMSHFENTAPYL
jgi:integrase